MAPGHLQQQQELLKQPQIMLQGLLLAVRAWLIPATPQWAELSLKERAGSSPHFSPAPQPRFSQNRGQVEGKPSVLQELFFQDHSHLTYILEKGFLADQGLQAQAPLSTTLSTPRNSSLGPRSSWPLVTQPHSQDFCSSSCTVPSQRQALHGCLGLTC